jgi:hypothetical protein
MNLFTRFLYAPPGGNFREFACIEAFFAPADAALYRQLLPGPFAMPEQPVVMVFAADYLKVAPWPVLIRYQEWAVLLKAVWRGGEGWCCLTIPVTRWGALVGGRHFGFPKTMASITLAKEGEGWTAQGMHKGVRELRLSYQPGLTGQLEPWEQALVAGESFFKGDALLLVPPAAGPRAQRVRLDHVLPPRWSPQPGILRLELDPGQAWAGLVPARDSFPGAFNHFSAGFSLVVVEQG